MLPFRAVRPFASMLAATALLTCLAAPAAAQDPADPNPGAITVSGALDFTNAYMFRGIKQESDGLIMQPYLDVGITLFTGEGSLKTFGINFGTWNSLHGFNDTGTDNTRNGKLWYESDFYLTLAFGLSGNVTAGMTYTAYTSPNDAFTTVKEVAFKIGVDDSAQLGKFALKPYGLIAVEMDTSTNTGQADGGLEAGTYVELGIAPGYSWPQFSMAFPVKVGLSLSNYYEDPITRDDSTFGFGSAAGIVTYPLSAKPTKFGTWNLHGGVEYQRLGSSAETFLNEFKDDGEAKGYKFIYSFGLGFTY